MSRSGTGFGPVQSGPGKLVFSGCPAAQVFSGTTFYEMNGLNLVGLGEALLPFSKWKLSFLVKKFEQCLIIICSSTKAMMSEYYVWHFCIFIHIHRFNHQLGCSARLGCRQRVMWLECGATSLYGCLFLVNCLWYYIWSSSKYQMWFYGPIRQQRTLILPTTHMQIWIQSKCVH